MKKLVLLGFVAAALLAGAATFVHTGTALAATPEQEICRGATGNETCSAPKGSPSVNSVINTAINTLSVFVGVIAIIMIIMAGFKYVTSGGDASRIGSAKNTLVYAVVGIVVAALAQVIVRFVVSRIL